MSHIEPNSPRISHLSWGHIEVEGHPPFKDAKIFPGGAREWDWRETGTRHAPGIQPADVQELIEHGARTVVLSNGCCDSSPNQHASKHHAVTGHSIIASFELGERW